MMSQIKQAVLKNNTIDAAVLVHKIKGIAGSIGAEDIHNLSAEMEISLNEMSRIQNFNDKIDNLASLVLDFFKNDAVLSFMK